MEISPQQKATDQRLRAKVQQAAQMLEDDPRSSLVVASLLRDALAHEGRAPLQLVGP